MKVARDVMIAVPVLLHSDHVTKARREIRDDIFREAYISDGKGRLAGYIDVNDVLRITNTKSNVTVEGYIQEPAVVMPDDPLERVAAVIRSKMTDSAAVISEDGAILGGILLSELFPILTTRHEFRGRVSEHMSHDVVVCSPDDHVHKIYNLIIESGFSAFPVVKDKALIGMVSRRDLLSAGRVRKALEGNINTKIEKNPANTRVESLMTTPVVTVSPDEPISTAAHLLVKHDISRMPVVRMDRIVGIVDRHDVLKGLIVKTD